MHDIRPIIPELFTQEESGSLLYIGARKDAHSWLDDLHQVGHKITLLEIWPKNIENLAGDKRFTKIIQGDVREIATNKKYDYVFWWHGPEHIEKEEFVQTIQRLESITKKIIALASPWGKYEQGPFEDNINESHVSTLYPEDFNLLGYETAVDGVQDEMGSQVVAWKKI